MKTAFFNGLVFTGKKMLQDSVVVVKDGLIREILDRSDEVPGNGIDLEGGYLVPAFIDIQLYGGNGLLFGEHPSVDSLKATHEYSLAGGSAYIMPTVGTNSREVMSAAIKSVREYWDQNLPGVLGLHLEGPYINPKKKGAHIEEFIQTPNIEEIKELLREGKGVIKMMTLAPEVCERRMIKYLKEHNVVVSAGHSNASYEQASQSFANDLSLATHLYNAMSGLGHRAPGMVGAIFDSDKAMASIVADGYHVDYPAIRIAKKIMGKRLFLITDAVTENKEGYYQHRLDGDKYVVADGTLSGSSLTLLKAVKNCIHQVGIPLEESLRMASLYPARAIGKDGSLGKIKEGYRADLVWLSRELKLRGVFTNGALHRFN